MVKNITGRKLTEANLRLSEEQFRTMFVEAPLGVALIDSLTGHIYEVNPKFASIAGRTREEMASIDWMSITHPEDVQEDLDNMADLNAGKIDGFNMEKRYINPDGTHGYIRASYGNPEGKAPNCFKAPEAGSKDRLDNECEVFSETSFYYRYSLKMDARYEEG